MSEPPERWTRSTVFADLWVDPADDPRDTGRSPVGERETLLDYLGAQRQTLRMKCEGLTPEQLALRSVPPSTMSLLGLVRHVAEMELHWVVKVMNHDPPVRPYSTAADRDGDFNGAVGDPAVVADAWALWDRAIAATDDLLARTDDLGTMSRNPDVDPISLREVLVHLIEEYARHCGHADLLRERIDGRVGQ